VKRFEHRGVQFVDSVDEVPGGAVLVFSAHGVSPAVRQSARDRGVRAIDSTCPLVTKVHMEAIRYARDGYQILLIGHKGHDEVVGTVGEAPGAIQVVESPEKIVDLDIRDPDRLVYLTQTTLSIDDAEQIIAALREAFPKIKSPPSDDICYATTNRQQAVRQVAPQCDLLLVVGSRNSSNSVRLTEIAEAVNTPARLIDDLSEMDDSWFNGVETVLLTSGASAPEDLVREILCELIERYGATVQQVDVTDERMEFGLPQSLKELMRDRGIDPTGRSVTVDHSAGIEDWLAERGGAGMPVRLTVSAIE
jgi:4-hydroxy-3-methylbut-2-enyl diphosphate reductase